MEYYAELKLRKDAHNGGFSNGMTLCGSESTRGLEKRPGFLLMNEIIALYGWRKA